MRSTPRSLALLAVIGALAFGRVSSAGPDDAKAGAQVVVFGDGAARFNVSHDRTAGTVTFRLADPSVRVTSAPVVVLQTSSGPQEVTLVPVSGEPGTWRLSHELARSERFDGTMKIVVGDKPYSAPLVVAAPALEARYVSHHGGRVIAFDDCGADVEVVRDMTTGTVTIYSSGDVQVLEAPTITLTTTTEKPAAVTVTKVEGQPGVWTVTNVAFKTTTVTGRMRILVDGKPCEAALAFGGAHGGDIVPVEGGPRFEVVRDERSRAYTFYAVDDTLDGKEYVVEDPRVVVTTPDGPRTVVLTRVENEPRAWRLIGLEGGVSRPLDGRLQFTLFGKSLETRLGLSGFSIDAR